MDSITTSTAEARETGCLFSFLKLTNPMQLFLFTRPNPEDCQKLLRISRSQYESKLAYEVKSNPRRFFSHVRRNRHLKQRIMALRADDGVVLTDSPNMARILANYYVSRIKPCRKFTRAISFKKVISETSFPTIPQANDSSVRVLHACSR